MKAPMGEMRKRASGISILLRDAFLPYGQSTTCPIITISVWCFQESTGGHQTTAEAEGAESSKYAASTAFLLSLHKDPAQFLLLRLNAVAGARCSSRAHCTSAAGWSGAELIQSLFLGQQ